LGAAPFFMAQSYTEEMVNPMSDSVLPLEDEGTIERR